MPIDIPALFQTIIVMTLLIGIVVTIHEFGHYIASKLCGVRVDEFAFGMGKMLIGKKWKGTLFRLNLLPLGGYVKVHGQEGILMSQIVFLQRNLFKRSLYS
jgi:regulator of sigma E protease